METLYIFAIVIISAAFFYVTKRYNDAKEELEEEIHPLKQEIFRKDNSIRTFITHINEMQAYVIERDEEIEELKKENSLINKELRAVYESQKRIEERLNDGTISDDLPEDPWYNSEYTEEDIYLKKYLEKDSESS